MGKRQVFYSFHFAKDSWRAAKIKNIGVSHLTNGRR